MLRSFTLALLLTTVTSANAQNSIPFFIKEPVIDGYADEGVVVTEFPLITKSDENNPDIRTGYYLAYDERSLYIYIEADADSLTLRDRGYQNGDGFHLVIGKPQENRAPTREFHVLGFSPENSWRRKMTWYYNVDLKMAGLGDAVQFKTDVKDGKISFEALIPWKEVHPYNPWLSDSIGFNLCFVKAVKDKGKNYYFITSDDRMQSEQSPRKYVVLRFEKPGQITSRFSSALVENHITEKETLAVTIAGYSERETTKKFTALIPGSFAGVVINNASLIFLPGISQQQITVNSQSLGPGDYTVKVFCEKELIGEHELSVFPEMDTDSVRAAIRSFGASIPAGTYHTLMFYVNDLDSALRKLKSYEASAEIQRKIAEIGRWVTELRSGNDPFAQKRGVYRRAYTSKTDHGLYPYSIYIPEGYDARKKSPLLVYLHGSGDDDRVLFKTAVIPEGFIVLAPNGRGTSNCFAGAEPQADILESIDDVIRNFNIDTTRIILSGFSMGGYGVYRTYYERPQRFKAIAVISGHPDLARRWVDENELNFLDEKNLGRFKNIPVYIFHGRNDMNCPFDLTEQLAKKLEKNGCRVVFEIDETGHGNMKPEIQERYFEWLRQQGK